jgi:hypothetical protein
MELTGQMLRFVAERVLGKPALTYQGQEIDLSRPWRRLDLRQGLMEVTGIDIDQYPTGEGLAAAMRGRDIHADPKAARGKLIDALLSDYLEPTLIQPTFMYDYPRDISPLAKSKPGNPQMVERFEVCSRDGACNAFTELNDHWIGGTFPEMGAITRPMTKNATRWMKITCGDALWHAAQRRLWYGVDAWRCGGRHAEHPEVLLPTPCRRVNACSNIFYAASVGTGIRNKSSIASPSFSTMTLAFERDPCTI